MATASTRAVLLLVTLCAAAAVASAWNDHGGHRSWQCARRCEDRPWHERARCVEECREEEREQGRSRHEEAGRRGDQRGEGSSSSGDEREREQGRSRHEEAGRRGDQRGEGSSSSGDEREREQGKEQKRSQRPYVFDRRSFRRIVRSDQGSVRALRPFHEVSKLLRGIRNYRVVVLEANPRSFVVPSHTDAHCIGYVAQGEGVVTTIEEGERRSYAIKEGHIFVAPAGAITYLANTDGRRKLVIAKILHTISVPGKFQFFFGPGGRNPESILSSFSKSILRAAYKTSSDRLERLFGRQDKGIFLRASEEQVRELRRQASEGGHGPHWPLPPFGESHGPYSLLDQRPRIANRHGQLYEADARSFRDLAEHDVRVSLANITAGSMSAPQYNTRSIKIAYVLDGEGHAEIVCPHLAHGGEGERGRGSRRSEEEEEESEGEEEVGQGYHTIRARLSRGTAFVVPVGHPFVVVASRGSSSNLQIVCFEVHAEKNEKVYLAGANNVLKKLDPAAKALSFGEEADEVLDAQPGKGFLEGPEKSGREEEERERGHHGRREEREEEEREGRHGSREEREREREQEQEQEEREGRHGDRGRREKVAETLLRMATAGL